MYEEINKETKQQLYGTLRKIWIDAYIRNPEENPEME